MVEPVVSSQKGNASESILIKPNPENIAPIPELCTLPKKRTYKKRSVPNLSKRQKNPPVFEVQKTLCLDIIKKRMADSK